jgi:hypothetical protein
MHEPPPVTRRTAQLAAGRQQLPDDLPFRIRQVARVHTTTPLRTSLIYPQHRLFTQPLRPHQQLAFLRCRTFRIGLPH